MSRSLAPFFPLDIEGINPQHLHPEKILHSAADLYLVSPPVGHHSVLVELIGLDGPLFRDSNCFYDFK